MVDISLKQITEKMYFLLLFGAMVFLIINPHHLYPVFILVAFFFICNITKFFFKLNDHEFFLLVSFFYVASFGERFTFGLYDQFFYYDKLLHFLAFAYITYIAYKRLKEYGLKEKIFFITILTALGVGSLVEIFEYIYDVFFNQGMQGVFDASFHTVINGLNDTILDMVTNLLGSLVTCSIIYKFEKDSNKEKEVQNGTRRR